jgi:hypothetical protein
LAHVSHIAQSYLDDGNDDAKEADGRTENLDNQDLDEEGTVLRISQGSTTTQCGVRMT